ncbi:PREDICTED: collagen alpha-1(I) chain-like [Haliaeetus leucocephalus]|uniref:collagen alpha-1(I) chain-like n=1 Tax=Haliaeetus leucocephalus TaxID=52644 RepID=UPI00053CBFF2|nr:PREDICTED: collagen alpha-1(I) chain-like [Haliaeetus leucocephalus]
MPTDGHNTGRERAANRSACEDYVRPLRGPGHVVLSSLDSNNTCVRELTGKGERQTGSNGAAVQLPARFPAAPRRGGRPRPPPRAALPAPRPPSSARPGDQRRCPGSVPPPSPLWRLGVTCHARRLSPRPSRHHKGSGAGGGAASPSTSSAAPAGASEARAPRSPYLSVAAAAAAGLGCRAPPAARGAANLPVPWLLSSRAAGSYGPGPARRVSRRRPREERRPRCPGQGAGHTPAPPRRSPPRRAGPRPRGPPRRQSERGRWAPRGGEAGSHGGRRGQRLPQAPRGARGGRARTGRPPGPGFRGRPGRAGRGKRPPLGARRTRRAARALRTAAAAGAPAAGPASGDRKTTRSLPGNCLDRLKTGRSSGYPRERERQKACTAGGGAFRVGIPNARIANKPNAFFLLCLGVVCQR